MTQEAFINNDSPGSFEPFPKATTRQVNKKFDTTTGTDKQWIRGYVYANDPDDTTKKEYVVAEADSERPFYVSIGYALKQLSGQTYITTDSQFSILGALQSDPLANALFEGVATLYIDGVVQPGGQVMPSDGTTTYGGIPGVLGHVMEWDGSNRKQIIGVYTGKIGQSGGKWTRTATADVVASYIDGVATNLGRVHVLPGG